MEFRRMKIEDIEFFNEVRSKSYKALHDNTNYSLEDNIKWFNKINPEFYIINAEVFGKRKDIGYIRTSDREERVIMIGMDLLPLYRGLGLGQKTYKQFIEKLKREGILMAKLEVLEFNERAHHIYKKLGFKETSRNEYKDTISIKMHKFLI